MSEKRVKIPNSELIKVVEDLRERGYSNSSISEEIGARIDSYLYYDNFMSLNSVKQLSNLYGRDISHEIVSQPNRQNALKYKSDSLAIDGKLAELIGIILGDGHIQKNDKNGVHYLEIALNSTEFCQINRAGYLIKEKTNLKPKIYEKKGHAVRIVAHSKDLVKKLEDLGLSAGDKKQNQVGVPSWIKDDEAYSKHCLRGLIDTDGSIYQDTRGTKSYIRIQFSNRSQELLNDFRDLCKKEDIKTVKGGKHQIQISRSDIDEFINEIKPAKSNGLKLLY